jgi:methylmalonyl-CoA mutase cobalamin-binding subunit
MSTHSGLHLTIGALSRATGVPINTLRTWERRYGVPSGDRTEGGHRLYPPDTVEHVRLVTRALDAGHRPAQVLPASVPVLRTLLGEGNVRPPPVGGPVDAWMTATRALDGHALYRGFSEEAARLGLPTFIEGRALPFLRRLGEEWCAGEIKVFHEHFASARLEDFLAGWWRPLSDSATGRPVVCATLPGDLHNLGLHMAAALIAAAGQRIVFLGRDTPIEDMAAAAVQSGATAVIVSIGASAQDPDGAIRALRAVLPASVGLFVGGPCAPDELDGVVYVAELGRLAAVVSAAG